MSNKKEAYFQGGGGVNEPTPGQPKYEKEDYQSLRDGEDKQMVGQMETGPVDGMHPGYDSFGEGEEERKRRLQRLAEEKAEERALRRQAVIDELKSKTAYFQGGGDVNEPTPGEPKYEKEDYQTNRDKNDKQMTGQAPFPGVGAVDGLHPSPASADESDELKRKQMLSRAKLKGSFYPAAKSDGTPDKGNSRWNVFAKSGDKKQLILTATVDEITGGKAELLYNSVASRDFGKHLLKLVQSHDVSKVAEMIKSAQMLEPMAPEAPAGEAEMPEDAGGTGDPKDELPELLDAAENTLADIRKAVEALMDEPGSELAEFEELAEGGLEAAAELRQLGKYQVKMAKALLVGMQKAAGALQENVEELQMSKQIKESKVALPEEHLKMASELTTAAMDDTRSTLDKCRELMQAFVSYAGGSKSVEKRAEELRANLVKAAQFAETGLKGDPLDPDLGLDDEPKAPAAPKQPGSPMQPREKTLEDYLRMFGFVGNLDALSPEQEDKKLAQVFSKAFDLFQRVSEENRGMALKLLDRLPRSLQILLLQGERFGKDSVTKMLASQSGPGYAKTYQADDGMDAHMGDDHHMGDDMNGGMDGLDALMTMMADDEGDMNDLEMTLQDGTKITASEQDDMTTKSGRAALRAKLAQKAMQYSDMLEKAHPGGGESPDLEVGEGELSNVERLDEQQKKDLDVATAPVAVRKMAEEIHNLVAEGKVDPAVDFPELIANGVDPAAVAYYKQYFGEAKDGGSEFATDLVKEHAQKKRAAEMEAYQVKVARAWELADDMVARSMLANDRQAKKAQVEEILKFNDEAFKTFAEFVSRQPVKKASAMPQVGQLMSSAEIHLPAPQAAPTNLQAELAAAFSQPRKNRTF